MLDILSVARARTTTKAFDASKPLSATHVAGIKELLRLGASSVNLQPWHFLVVSSDAGKERLLKGFEGMCAFNRAKVEKAPLSVVFCAKTTVDDAYMAKILEKEDADGRFIDAAAKEGMKGGRATFVGLHVSTWNDVAPWMEKQVYLNLGSFLLGVAAMELDAVAMEGVDREAVDREFGLAEKGLVPLCVVSVGFRDEALDFNARLPKSRLNEADILTEL